jgi:hypothetical protein
VGKGTKYFVVGRGENARQTRSLSCVFFKRTANSLFAVRFFFAMRPVKTDGKQPLCRASEIKRTTKILTHGKHGFSRSACLFHTATTSLCGAAASEKQKLGATAMAKNMKEICHQSSIKQTWQFVVGNQTGLLGLKYFLCSKLN